MRMRATAAWVGAGRPSVKRGRPKKNDADANRYPGCVWPARGGGGPCCGQVEHGLALCREHAKVLSGEPGAECAWPGCEQTSPFAPLCTYHRKLAEGLLEASH